MEKPAVADVADWTYGARMSGRKRSGGATMDTLTELGKTIALRLEEEHHKQGWDRPATLYEIYGADVDPKLVDLIIKAERPGEDGDWVGAAFGVAPVEELDGHPADAMVGKHAQHEETLGVVLITEGWNYPQDVLEQLARGEISPDQIPSPSTHPRRVEVRLATAVFRDGTQTTVWRTRGEESKVWDEHARLQGRVMRALRRYLRMESAGLPAAPPRRLLAHTLARAGVTLANEAASINIMGSEARNNLIQLLTEISPHIAALGEDINPAVYQMLSTPLGMPGLLLAPALYRDSWDGYYEDVRRNVDAYLEAAPENRQTQAWQEWLAWLDWADGPMLIWDMMDRMAVSVHEELEAGRSVKWFNTRLAENPAPLEITPVINLYRTQIKALEEAAGNTD